MTAPGSSVQAVGAPASAGAPGDFAFPQRYEPLRLLGTGTHGRVFQARDIQSGEFVALKHVRRSGARSIGLKEFSAVLAVDHPSIVRCLDFHYLEGGDTCLVYEYVEGGTLRDRMREGEAFDPEEWMACARDVLEGLDVLHRSHLLHCDLKPENILCQAQTGGATRYRISDLGIARFSSNDARPEAHGVPAGAPGYMAPENFQQVFSPAGDLYSLGVVLFELACGCRPYDGDVRELAKGHLFGRIPMHRIKHAEQSELVGWLLQREPTSRPSSASVALGRLLGLATPQEAPGRAETVVGSQLPRQTIPSKAESYVLTSLCRHHLALRVGNRALLGSVYDGHIELADATNGAPLNLFIPCGSGLFQILPDGGIAAAEPTRLVLWTGDFRVPCILQTTMGRPRALAYAPAQATTAWIEGEHVIVKGLGPHASTRVIECPGAGLSPRLLTASGQTHFILVPGSARPEALWIDMDGKRVGSKAIPGPVIESSPTSFPALFCAGPAEFGPARLHLLLPGSPGEMVEFIFDRMPLFHCFCDDGIVIGKADGTVVHIGKGGHESRLESEVDDTSRQLWSTDRSFLLRLRESGHRRYIHYQPIP